MGGAAPCGKCTQLVPAACVNRHEGSGARMPPVPCHAAPAMMRSRVCGVPCGRQLCERHACTRTCHAGPCDGGGAAAHPCGMRLQGCGHACALSCGHEGACEDSPCGVAVRVRCACAGETGELPCHAARRDGAGKGASPLNDHDAPPALSRVPSLESCPPEGTEALAVALQCSALCRARAERHRVAVRLASVRREAGAAAVVPFARSVLAPYCDAGESWARAQKARADIDRITAVEDKITELVQSARAGGATSTVLTLDDRRGGRDSAAVRAVLRLSRVAFEADHGRLLLKVTPRSRVPPFPLRHAVRAAGRCSAGTLTASEWPEHLSADLHFAAIRSQPQASLRFADALLADAGLDDTCFLSWLRHDDCGVHGAAVLRVLLLDRASAAVAAAALGPFAADERLARANGVTRVVLPAGEEAAARPRGPPKPRQRARERAPAQPRADTTAASNLFALLEDSEDSSGPYEEKEEDAARTPRAPHGCLREERAGETPAVQGEAKPTELWKKKKAKRKKKKKKKR